jgi:DNA processing protein
MLPGNLLDWVALTLLPGLGPTPLQRALEVFGGPGPVAFAVPAEELAAVGRGGARTAGRIRVARRTLRRDAEREIRRTRQLGARLLTRDDPAWPAAFEPLPDPPLALWVRGSLGLGRLRIAVIGSRRPTSYGRHVATGVAATLASRGVEIVSGGARGVDSLAHEGALEAGGSTVAVLGSGLLRPYPPENKRLFDRIADRGALVTEFPLDTPPHAGHFPRRNRLISGLSAAVVVVEATRRSGTLGTASQALEQGREVMAIPGPVTSDRSVGCHRLIQQGAKLVQNTEDILDELSPMYRAALTASPPPGQAPEGAPEGPAAGSDEAAVLALLDPVEPLHLDRLAERAPFGIARLQAALFGLLLAGSVEERPGRYYLCRPRGNRDRFGTLSDPRSGGFRD